MKPTFNKVEWEEFKEHEAGCRCRSCAKVVEYLRTEAPEILEMREDCPEEPSDGKYLGIDP